MAQGLCLVFVNIAHFHSCLRKHSSTQFYPILPTPHQAALASWALFSANLSFLLCSTHCPAWQLLLWLCWLLFICNLFSDFWMGWVGFFFFSWMSELISQGLSMHKRTRDVTGRRGAPGLGSAFSLACTAPPAQSQNHRLGKAFEIIELTVNLTLSSSPLNQALNCHIYMSLKYIYFFFQSQIL